MSSLEQLMMQHGIAYYTFDEDSGHTHDWLGLSGSGVVVGATRVQGWNGKGNAVNFNGVNNYIAIATQVVPNAPNMTIRIKVKANTVSVAKYIMGTNGTYSANLNTGILLTQMPDNQYRFTYQQSGVEAFSLYTGVIDLTKWSDIMMVISENKAYLYYNNKLVAMQNHNLSALNHSYPLSLGNIRVDSTNWVANMYFNGQLDDLQIYNKALTPKDFPQERVAIKTSRNFSPSLPFISTRIKEIPDANTNTLLAQGAIVKEINHAIDNSSQFDLEKSIDEYEVVSNTVTPLGSGKGFTISTTQEFKTILIEDNY